MSADSGGGGGGAYDVRPSVLADGADWLEQDSSDIRTEGTAASGATSDAGGASAPGSVVLAGGRFAAAITSRSGEMSGAVAHAGQALAGNACAYWATDTGAAELLGR